MARKMPIYRLVDGLKAARERRDGYIMGATGQDPKRWAAASWWFTQYTRADQRKKALYWREHAQRVWDCNGLAEGLYRDYTGRSIDTRARYNFAQWCDPRGAGMIPASGGNSSSSHSLTGSVTGSKSPGSSQPAS